MTNDELKSWIEAAEKCARYDDDGDLADAARTDLPRMAALLRAALAVVEEARFVAIDAEDDLDEDYAPISVEALRKALAAFEAEARKA